MTENVEIILSQNDASVLQSNTRVDKGVDAIAKSWREAAKQALSYAGLSEKMLKTTPWQNGQMQRGMSAFIQGQRVQIQQMATLRRVAAAAPAFGGRLGLGSQLRQVVGLTAGYVGLRSAISLAQESGREFYQERDQAILDLDLQRRQFQGQSGQRGFEAQNAFNRIDRAAITGGLGNEQTYSVAKQLVSSGFSPDEATGESMRKLIDGLRAMNVAGKQQVDFGELAQATSMYLSAQDLGKNGKSVGELMRRVQALVKFTNLQIPDFAEFARESSSLKGVLPVGEQLGAFSVLRDVMDGPEAAVGMRNVVSRLQTAAAYPEKTEALHRIGLKPEDVDMVGEDFVTAMRRFSQALHKAPAEVQPQVMVKIFEERGKNTARILMDKIEEVVKNIAAQLDQAQYDSDVALAKSGPVIQAERQAADRQQKLAQYGQSATALGNELDTLQLEERRSPMLAAAKKGLAGFLRYTGILPEEQAFGFAYGPKQTVLARERAAEKAKPNPRSDAEVEADVRRRWGSKLIKDVENNPKLLKGYETTLNQDDRWDFEAERTRRKVDARKALDHLKTLEDNPLSNPVDLAIARGAAQATVENVPTFEPRRKEFDAELNGGPISGASPPQKPQPSALDDFRKGVRDMQPDASPKPGRNPETGRGREIDLMQWIKNWISAAERNTSALEENNRLMSRQNGTGGGTATAPQVSVRNSPVSRALGRA